MCIELDAKRLLCKSRSKCADVVQLRHYNTLGFEWRPVNSIIGNGIHNIVRLLLLTLCWAWIWVWGCALITLLLSLVWIHASGQRRGSLFSMSDSESLFLRIGAFGLVMSHLPALKAPTVILFRTSSKLLRAKHPVLLDAYLVGRWVILADPWGRRRSSS